MKTKQTEILKRNLSQNIISNDRKRTRAINVKSIVVALFAMLLMGTQNTFAHCDSFDGPVIKEAMEALASNDVKLVSKWIDKAEIGRASCRERV